MGDPVTVAAVLSTAVGTIQQQVQAKAQRSAQQAATNRQIAQQQLEQQTREKKQRELAKQEQATARASFGARGVSSTGGSAKAALEGIDTRTDKAIAENRQLSDFGIQALRENQQARNRQSVLQSRNSLMNTVIGTGGQIIQSWPKS